MSRWKNILFNATLFINCLLVFLVLFESGMVIPSWLQVVGRMHPLFLHFPLVLFLVSIAWMLFTPVNGLGKEIKEDIGRWLLLFAACVSAITAAMGLFLSREAGYNNDSLFWHKWSGLFIAWISFAWYLCYLPVYKKRIFTVAASVFSIGLILFTGHQGARITHGENFLLAPVTPVKEKKKVLLDDAVVFADMVQPILETKCMGCHNSTKAKGELVMETKELLLRGGKSGVLWDTSKSDLGLLLQRIHLPEEEKKHMPPAGKPQLTNQETEILFSWIKHGADFNQKVSDLSPADTLRLIAGTLFKNSLDEDYAFAAASEKTIQKLNTSYRSVYPLAIQSPALAVDFYGQQFFSSGQLKELDEIKQQLVSLNLDKMPVKDEDLKVIGGFTNLRKLNLAFTQVGGASLGALSGLGHLKSLSLTGTKVTAAEIGSLTGLKELKELFLWNTGITRDEIAGLIKSNKDLQVEFGVNTDTLSAQLNSPLLQNDQFILDTPVLIKLKHYVPGVSIHFTLDGSEPDSLLSPLYTGKEMLTQHALLKAKAYKKGWKTSDSVQAYFYSGMSHPDSILFLQPIDSDYMKNGARTLIDRIKGDMNYNSGKWLGFHKNPLECLTYFSQAQKIRSVTISSLVSVGSYIMPPESIEIYGGNSPSSLSLLARLTPPQPVSNQPSYLTPFECSFVPHTVRCLKIKMNPVVKLPAWHSGKGKRAWVFADELFFN